MAATATEPRLKARYKAEIVPALNTEFGFSNIMQTPRVVKVVVNMGVGEAAKDSKLIEGAIRDLMAITGQRPSVTKARKSIAQFKVREGQPIGCSVTLRGKRMHVFSYRVPQSTSKYSIRWGDGPSARTIIAGYRGLIYADRETFKVMRLQLEAEKLQGEQQLAAQQAYLGAEREAQEDAAEQQMLQDIGARIEQIEQRGLFRVVRLGRIARRRADTGVSLLDQFLVGEILPRRITPIVLAHLFMHAFGKGFCQTIGQRRQQDGAVIILGILEGLQMPFLADARRHDKAADIILGAFGGDEVRQRQVRPALLARHLLAQGMQCGDGEFPRLVAIDKNVVLGAVGRPEAYHRFGRQPFF